MSAGQPPDASELLKRSLGPKSALAAARAALPAYEPPFPLLANHEGWVVPLDGDAVGPRFDPLPDLPATVRDNSTEVLAIAAGVAAEYAWWRDPGAAVSPLLRRESPVAIIVPTACPPEHYRMLHEAGALGIPLLARDEQFATDLELLVPRWMRRRGHAAKLGRPHDPALVAQTFAPAGEIGGNPLSSFVVYDEAERDGVQIAGEMSDSFGLEVGIRGINLGRQDTGVMESLVAAMPGFLDGVSSRVDGDSLRIGWRDGAKPTPELLAQVIRTWLPLWYDLEKIDIRIVFAPAGGDSPLLADMRSRARAYKELRAHDGNEDIAG